MSQESKSISAAKRLIIKRRFRGYSPKQADNFIRVVLRNDLPVLRTKTGGKFILGVTRIAIDGELRDADTINRLNTTLKLVASDAHINEYDRNLNGLTANDLIQRFARVISDNTEAEKAEIDAMSFNGDDSYDIVPINTFDDAAKYSRYTTWCITHDEKTFNTYTSDGIKQFYFCLKQGFENVQKEPGENTPLDNYGLSMLAVCVDENGTLSTCTCRWNHDHGGNDSIMNAKQISEVIGRNFYVVFKPNNKWGNVLAEAERKLANGERPEDVFDKCYAFEEGFARVVLTSKWNFINAKGEYLSEQWFDYCDGFHDGFTRVILNYRCNFINKDGKLLSNQWFDWCGDFSEGVAKVKLNDRYNLINKEGKYLFDQWFDWCSSFCDGFAVVVLNGKQYQIGKTGKINKFRVKAQIYS